MNAFSAVLGLHAAMTYVSSRKAIGVSVGTLLFLFLGVSTCMRMMLALSDTFDGQMASFLGFIVGGGLALFVALCVAQPFAGARRSRAFAAPLAMFYAIVSFLIGSYSLVGLATVVHVQLRDRRDVGAGAFGVRHCDRHAAVAATMVSPLWALPIASGRRATWYGSRLRSLRP